MPVALRLFVRGVEGLASIDAILFLQAVWRQNGTRDELAADGDVCLKGTDGTQFVGSVGGRAALWGTVGSAPVHLGPAGFFPPRPTPSMVICKWA